MILKVNLKEKEASIDADVEKLVEKRMEIADNHPERKSRYQIKQEERRKNEELRQRRPKKKTRYQIRQEEKRKNAELKYKQGLLMILLLIGVIVLIIIFSTIASALGW